MIDERRRDEPRILGGGSVLLDGIIAPEKGSPEEAVLLNVLKRTLLNKKVNVNEYLNGATSFGGSIYVTDDPKRFAPEDNVNLMLVREGFARFSGIWNSYDGTLGGLRDAQRLAQEEKKGIWAYQEVTPEIVQPPASFTNWYSTVVTNVPDATHVTFGERKIASVYVRPGYTVQLDGIAAPEKGAPEEDALRDAVEKALLDKRVNVIELKSRDSWCVSVYVTDDPKRFASEDNVNLMLVREGFARFSGELNSTDELLGGMAEAQRLAQEERKGIWANHGQEATPDPDQPPVAIETTPPDSVPVAHGKLRPVRVSHARTRHRINRESW